MKTSLRAAGLTLAVAALAAAQLCPQWSEGRLLGALDEKTLFEASGLAASRQFPGRWYHVNDSGNASGFVISDAAGGNLQTVLLTLPRLIDPEDLAVGPCDDAAAAQCLFIGDIGDNSKSRKSVSVVIVREQQAFESRIRPDRRLKLRYPDGPHDAESLAVHPESGDLYILAKEFVLFPGSGSAATLYRAPADIWRKAKETDVIPLEIYGSIDLPAMTKARKGRLSHVATAMDISPDGERLLVQSYDHAWEIDWDLADGPPPSLAELSYQIIRLSPLLGKETIAWLADGSGFVHGKEFKPDEEPSVLIRFDCLAE